MGGTSFYGWSLLSWNFLEFSCNWGIQYKKTRYKFFANIFLHCYNQVAIIVTLIFRLSCLLQKMPALDRNDEVTCGNCGTSVTKITYLDTKRDAQLEPYNVPNVPAFQHCPRMI